MNISKTSTLLLKIISIIFKKIFAFIGTILCTFTIGLYVVITIALELILVLIPVYGVITPGIISIITRKPFQDTIINYWNVLLNTLVRLSFATSASNKSKEISTLLHRSISIHLSYPNWAVYLLVVIMIIFLLLLIRKIIEFPVSWSPQKRIIRMVQSLLNIIINLWKN